MYYINWNGLRKNHFLLIVLTRKYKIFLLPWFKTNPKVSLPVLPALPRAAGSRAQQAPSGGRADWPTAWRVRRPGWLAFPPPSPPHARPAGEKAGRRHQGRPRASQPSVVPKWALGPSPRRSLWPEDVADTGAYATPRPLAASPAVSGAGR